VAEPFAVVLDRDGVICENRSEHVRSWRDFAFVPGAIEAMASLQRAGADLYIATNQPVVGKGFIGTHDLDVIHEKMQGILHGAGVTIKAIAACIHHPLDGCGCRKPATGMLVALADRHDFRLEESFVVGDWISDIEAGASVGAATVLVRTGRGKQAERIIAAGEGPVPDRIADDLIDAAFWILAERGIAVTSGRLDARDRRPGTRKR
jgi:D-glycero-D-manno-heptose 1,7-bisphosphate phosphatase